MTHKFENTQYKGRVKWGQGKRFAVIINDEVLHVSRRIAGILSLFDTVPEVSRDQIWAYLERIGENTETKSASSVLSRTLSWMKHHGLVVEYQQKFYQTVKGRVVWLALKKWMKERLEQQLVNDLLGAL